jgi:hypothetical protein
MSRKVMGSKPIGTILRKFFLPSPSFWVYVALCELFLGHFGEESGIEYGGTA